MIRAMTPNREEVERLKGAGVASITDYPAPSMIIGSEHISGGGRRTHRVINPATGETLGEVPLADPADLDRALEIAAEGFRVWRDAPAQQRAGVLLGAARPMLERQDDLARMATP